MICSQLPSAQLNDPAQDAILAKLRATIENWFTYTPGEKERFFAYYPRRKGLVLPVVDRLPVDE